MENQNNIFVIGDIHGGYFALIEVLEASNVTKTDLLIFLGDYVDGWSDSPKVIDYLIELRKTHNCIFLKGNHDELLLHWLLTKEENLLWLKHGGVATVKSYSTVSEKTKQLHIKFLESLENYYLDDLNRLFIHAGFTNPNGINAEYFPKMFYWDRTLWETALSLNPLLKSDDLCYPKRFNLYAEIYIGHTPVTRINKTIPVNKANVWNIDTGAAFKGPLTIMNVNTKQFWQSKPVCEWYPDETGRN